MKKEIIVVFLVLIVLFGVNQVLFAKEMQKKILVVHSYHKDAEWTSAVNRGIKRVLQTRRDISYEIFYMDAKRNISDIWKEKVAKSAKNIIDQWKPDLLLLVDDTAQELVGKYYVGKSDLPIVFTGLNNPFSMYGYDKADNVTGLVETPRFRETIDFFKKINPKAKTFVVLSDDSESSHGAVAFIKEQSKGIDVLGFETIKTFSVWKKKIKEYEKKVDAIYVYTYGTLVAEDEKSSVLSADVMRWTSENSSVPVLGAFIFAVDSGALCGVVESGMEQGQEAAHIAKAIIDGESIASHPVHSAKKALSVLDKMQLRKFGLHVSKELESEIDVVLGDTAIG